MSETARAVDTRVRCDECMVYVGTTLHGNTHWHNPDCSKSGATMEERLEYWKASYQRLAEGTREASARNEARRRRLREQVGLWQAKFHTIRHENNVLRRKLRTLQSGDDHEST